MYGGKAGKKESGEKERAAGMKGVGFYGGILFYGRPGCCFSEWLRSGFQLARAESRILEDNGLHAGCTQILRVCKNLVSIGMTDSAQTIP